MNNIFFTTTVHLSAWPPKRVEGDPIELHTQDEAIAKMHRFCHEIYNVPITWITSYGALMKYGDTLKEYCEKYGDEVGIMEYGIYSEDVLEGKADVYQSWVEEIGMSRPSSLNHEEDEVPGIITWYGMSYEDQKKAITYLKKRYEEVLGTEVVTFASPFHNNDTMKILKELEFECIWGNNWDYFCEGMDHKGSSPHSFYRNINDQNSPETCEEDRGPLAIAWGLWNFNKSIGNNPVSRGGVGFCSNPTEYTNRGPGMDKYHYFEKWVDDIIANKVYNPYILLPLQLEAVWMDEGPMVEGYIDQYPDYALRATEAFYLQIEYCMSVGAKGMTQKAFAKWHKENIGKTSEYIACSRKLDIPSLRIMGNDREYEPALIFANDKIQYTFSKSCGTNYVSKWKYSELSNNIKEKAFRPAAPRVQLQNNFSICVYTGVQVSDEGAKYIIEGMDYSAYCDYDDYAGVIWTANLPEYVNEDNVVTDGLKGFRLLHQDDLVLFFADMKEGDNHFKLYSDEPDKYIKIVRSEVIGRRYEIWIKNDGVPVKLSKINTNIGANRSIGCFWWNGEQHRSVGKFGHCVYDQKTGNFVFGTGYPVSFELRTGYNRLSLELF